MLKIEIGLPQLWKMKTSNITVNYTEKVTTNACAGSPALYHSNIILYNYGIVWKESLSVGVKGRNLLIHHGIKYNVK